MNTKLQVALLLLSWSALVSAQWSYTEKPDQMRKIVNKVALLKSLNTNTSNSGPATLTIVAWDDAKVINPDERQYLGLRLSRGMLDCNITEHCEFHVQFDDEEPIGLNAEPITDYDTMWLTNGSSTQLFDIIAKARKVTIEVPMYRVGAKQFKFNMKPIKWRTTN